MKAKGKAVQSTCDGGSNRKDKNQQELARRGQHCATMQRAVYEESFTEAAAAAAAAAGRRRRRTAATLVRGLRAPWTSLKFKTEIVLVSSR
jgi:hypothetical protein